MSMKKMTIVLPADTVEALLGVIPFKHIQSLVVEDIAVTPTISRSIGPKRRIGNSAKHEISRHFSLHKEFTIQDAVRYLGTLGYKYSSASAALNQMIAKGFAERVADSTYRMIKSVPPDYKFSTHAKAPK